MKNNHFMVSYAVGSMIALTLGSLTLWQFARLIPAFGDGLKIILLVLAIIPLFIILIAQKIDLLPPYFFVFFLVGLGGILAWN